MIDLSKKVLPSTVEVEGVFFSLKTDFHYWIRFEQLIKTQYEITDFDYLYLHQKPKNRIKGLVALMAFAFPPVELPRATGESDNVIYFDNTKDADFIFAAFMQQYHINLLESSMHWYEYRALFNGLKDTKLNDIMSYRGFKPGAKRTAYDKQMLKLRDAWTIEPELTEEEQKKLDEFDAQLK